MENREMIYHRTCRPIWYFFLNSFLYLFSPFRLVRFGGELEYVINSIPTEAVVSTAK